MSRRQLTPKQRAFLDYLQTHLRTHSVWPTYREVVEHFDYRSPNSVTQNLHALTRKGFLQRDRSGYHLMDSGSGDGTISVRGSLRQGRLEAAEKAEPLSLGALFRDFTGVHALRLDEQTHRTHELGQAEYVLVSEDDVPSGDLAVVLCGTAVALGRVGPDGRVVVDGVEGEPHVLGRYAGHAGPYGVLRRAAEPSVTATSAPVPQPLAQEASETHAVAPLGVA